MTETAELYGPITSDISDVGARLQQLTLGHHALLGEALSHVFASGGKRIRPALVLLSGKLGTYHKDRLVTLSASLEVVHTATLVHDDTIDEALSRRGLSTVSAVWNRTVAILIGDFLFAQSAKLAAELDSVPIMKLLSETVMEMSSGELRQYAATRSRTVDEADYLARIKGKTASLFSMCCEGAAVVSEQTSDRVQALRAFGMNLGLAFQIADDVLDFVGDEASLGKPAGSDLRQGTLTLPVILLAQQHGANSSIARSIGNPEAVGEVIEAVRTSGVVEAALDRAREYSARARRNLEVFPRSEARETLLNLTEHVVSRSR